MIRAIFERTVCRFVPAFFILFCANFLIGSKCLASCSILGKTEVCEYVDETYNLDFTGTFDQVLWNVQNGVIKEDYGDHIVVKWDPGTTGTVEATVVVNGQTNSVCEINVEISAGPMFTILHPGSRNCGIKAGPTDPVSLIYYCIGDIARFENDLEMEGEWTLAWETGPTIHYSGEVFEPVLNRGEAAEVCLTLEDENGCVNTECITMEVLYVNAYFEAIGYPGLSQIDICNGQELNFMFDAVNFPQGSSYNYHWEILDINNNVIKSLDADNKDVKLIHEFSTPGIFKVVLEVKNCYGCVGTYAMTVNVEQDPVLEIECPSVICEGETVLYSTPGTCNSYQWTFEVDGQVIATGNTNPVSVTWDNLPQPHSGFGTITLEATGCSGTNCTSPTTVTIAIIPDITTPIDGPDRICDGNSTVTYSLPLWPGASYSWEMPEILSSTSGSLTSNSALNRQEVSLVGFNGTFKVKCIVEHLFAGCSFESELVVTVEAYEIAGEISYCKGDDVSFELVPSPPANYSTDFTIINSQGVVVCQSSATEISCSGLPSGNYLVSVMLEDIVTGSTISCDDIALNFIIQPEIPPVEDADIEGDRAVCPDQDYVYSYTGPLAPGDQIRWEIEGGEFKVGSSYLTLPRTGLSVTAKWMSSGPRHLVVKRLRNGCYSSGLQVNIHSIEEAAISIEGLDAVCPNSTEEYFLFSGGFPVSLPSRPTWSITPAHLGAISQDLGNRISVKWHYPTSGTSQATIRVDYEDCLSQSHYVEKTITVLPPPSLTITGDEIVCAGESGFYTATLTGGNGNVGNLSWSVTLPNGSTIQEGNANPEEIVFTEGGTHIVRATMSDMPSCPGNVEASYTVTVRKVPIPHISTFDEIPCRGNDFDISLYTQQFIYYPGGNHFMAIEWFLDGNSISYHPLPFDVGVPPINGYGTGIYQVRGVEYDHGVTCFSELSAPMVVMQDTCIDGSCVPEEFEAFGITEITNSPDNCGEVHIEGEINDFNDIATAYWQIGNIPPGSGIPPIIPINNQSDLEIDVSAFNQPGYYPIELIASHVNTPTCFQYDKSYIIIPTLADFRWEVACDGNGYLEFQLVDNSRTLPLPVDPNDSRKWFVDGAPLASADEMVTFTVPGAQGGGTKEVCLVVTNPFNFFVCEKCVDINIPRVPIINGIDYEMQNICTNSAVAFEADITNPGEVISYAWDFGDGSGSSLATPEKIYTMAGSYHVALTIQNKYGCESTYGIDIDVLLNVNNGKIEVMEDEAACNKIDVEYINESGTPVYFEWSTGEEGATLSAISVSDPGTYGLTVTYSTGCPKIIEFSVDEFFPENIEIVQVIGCNLIQFLAPVIPGYTASWSSNPPLSNQFSGRIFYTLDPPSGQYVFTYELFRNGVVCYSEDFEVDFQTVQIEVGLEILNCAPFSARIYEQNGHIVQWKKNNEFLGVLSNELIVYEGGSYSAFYSQGQCFQEVPIEVEDGIDFSYFLSGCYSICERDIDGSQCLQGIPGSFTSWEWMSFNSSTGAATSLSPPVSGSGTIDDLCLTANMAGEIILRVESQAGCMEDSDPFCLELLDCTLCNDVDALDVDFTTFKCLPIYGQNDRYYHITGKISTHNNFNLCSSDLTFTNVLSSNVTANIVTLPNGDELRFDGIIEVDPALMDQVCMNLSVCKEENICVAEYCFWRPDCFFCPEACLLFDPEEPTIDCNGNSLDVQWDLTVFDLPADGDYHLEIRPVKGSITGSYSHDFTVGPTTPGLPINYSWVANFTWSFSQGESPLCLELTVVTQGDNIMVCEYYLCIDPSDYCHGGNLLPMNGYDFSSSFIELETATNHKYAFEVTLPHEMNIESVRMINIPYGIVSDTSFDGNHTFNGSYITDYPEGGFEGDIVVTRDNNSKAVYCIEQEELDEGGIGALKRNPQGIRQMTGELLSVRPNPADRTVFFDYKLDKDLLDMEEPVDLYIKDVLGRVVFLQRLTDFSGTVPLVMDKNKSGVYIGYLKQGDKTLTARKFVIIH